MFHVMSHADEMALLRRAKAQAGVFSRAQAHAVGFTDQMIRHRLRLGTWLRVGGGGIYLLPSHPWGWRQQCHAALLAHPEGALAGTSAAVLYQMTDGDTAERPHVTVPPSATGTSRLAVVRRSSLLRPRLVEGYRVNSPALVLRELAAEAPDLVRDAYERAVLARRVRPDQVADVAVVASCGRMRGAAALRQLLDEVADERRPQRSVLERWLERVVDDPRLPLSEAEAPAPWDPHHELVDRWFPSLRMIVEADGRAWHARIDAFANDRRRDQEALRLGVPVLRFGYTQIRDEPRRCCDVIVDTARAFGRLAA